MFGHIHLIGKRLSLSISVHSIDKNLHADHRTDANGDDVEQLMWFAPLKAWVGYLPEISQQA